jgi:hypothetical protein
MNAMTTTMMNLRVEAEAEARRLAVARSLDRTRREPAGETACQRGPLIRRARGARRRKPLAGRALFIWQVACEDAAGRRSPPAIVAVLASRDCQIASGAEKSDLRNLATAFDTNPPDPIQHVLRATQREVLESVRAHALAHLERERAIAADGARTPRAASYQAGLFDRRGERDHQQLIADAERAEQLACSRVAAASAAATVTSLRPTLLLVLTAQP